MQKTKEQNIKDIIRFDDEEPQSNQDKGDKDPIGQEITDFLTNADKLINVLEKIVPGLKSDAVVNKEAFVKIVKPLVIGLENLLPRLLEYQDNLEYLKDENAEVLRRKIAHIEDELLPPLLEYLKENAEK